MPQAGEHDELKIALVEWVSRFVLIIGLLTLFATIIEHKHAYQGDNYFIGASLGLRDFVVENAKCIYNLVMHPLVTTREMIKAAIHYDQTLAAIKGAAQRTIDKYPQMSNGEKGRLHFRLMAESLYMIGVLVVPSLGVLKLGQGSILQTNALAQKIMRPVVRLTSKNSSEFQQVISFAEWFAYEN